MNRQLGWTSYVTGRGDGVQAFDNLIFDVGWVFQPGQFPPGNWKYTIPIHDYWAQIPSWNMPRVPSGLIYFAQEWRAYNIQGEGAFLTGNFSPVFSGDGDPTIGFSNDNFWPDWDPVPDGIFSENEYDWFGGPPNEANFLMTLTTQATGTTDIVKPAIATILRGKVTGGNIGSLHFIDQNYYKVTKFIVANLTEPAVQFTLEGFSPNNNLTGISIDMMSKANTVGLQQTYYLYNYVTSQYVQLDQRPAPITDTRLTISAPGTATDYVDIPNGNVVKMKVTYKQTGPTAIFSYGCLMDMANWLVSHP